MISNGCFRKPTRFWRPVPASWQTWKSCWTRAVNYSPLEKPYSSSGGEWSDRAREAGESFTCNSPNACDNARVSDAESKKRLLQFAIERLGKEQVAARLNVTQQRLDEWISGDPDMTHSKVLALADLISSLDRDK